MKTQLLSLTAVLLAAAGADGQSEKEKVYDAGAMELICEELQPDPSPKMNPVDKLRKDLAEQTKQFGTDHWKVIDARLKLEDAARFAQMNEDQKRTVARIYGLNSRVDNCYKQGQLDEAVTLTKEMLALRQELLGKNHYHCARSLVNLGFFYRQLKKHNEAEKSYLASLVIMKDALGAKHPIYAQALVSLAHVYRDKKDSENVEPLYRDAISIWKHAHGEDHPTFVAWAKELAEYCMGQREYSKAEPLFLQVLELRKRSHGVEDLRYASSLHDVGFCYSQREAYAKAESYYVGALKIRKDKLGVENQDYLSTLNNLAVVYRSQGAYPRAESMFNEIIETQKKLNQTKQPKYGMTLMNLAVLYSQQELYTKAEPLFLEALQVYRKSIGERNSHFATGLNNLAGMYRAQGDTRRAAKLYAKALDITRLTATSTDSSYATQLNNLGVLYDSLGDYARAEPLFREAIRIYSADKHSKHPNHAICVGNLARLYHSTGQLAKSDGLFGKAVELGIAVEGEIHPHTANRLHNQAMLNIGQKEYDKAEKLLRQSQQIYKKLFGERHVEYADSVNGLGYLYVSQRKYSEAQKHFEDAVRLYREVASEKDYRYANSLNNLAYVHDQRGDAGSAKQLYSDALRAARLSDHPLLLREMRPVDFRCDPITTKTLLNAAALFEKSGRENKSIEDLRVSEDYLSLANAISDRIRNNMESPDSKSLDIERTYDAVTLRIGVLNSLHLLERNTGKLEDAFGTAEGACAQGFLEILGGARVNVLAEVREELQNQEAEALRNLQSIDLAIEKESSKRLEKRVPKMMDRLIVEREKAESRVLQIRKTIEDEYPQYAALKYPRPCKLIQAQNSLFGGELAVLLVTGVDKSFIVLVEARPAANDKSNGIAIIEIPNKEKLTDLVAPLIDPESLASPRSKILARQAFDAILGPVKDRIKDKDLVIVPNGQLCFLPFEMLVEPDGKYLVEKHRIRYAPSLTALHFINLWKQKRAKSEVPLFAVGDPVYHKGYQRLEHSGYEVAQIAKLLKAKDEFVLTRDKASKAEVKKLSDANTISKAKYVHFATHGILGLDRGKQPALVLSQGKPKPKAKDDLFADDEDEGLLQMDEITGLKLNADLVVLSACKSGQGRLHQGEGVTGIARAFLYAGSKGVMCSLWSVDDRETANLMVDFYGHLDKGKSAPEALREAQLAMIRQGKAPYYWAPFIVIGE